MPLSYIVLNTRLTSSVKRSPLVDKVGVISHAHYNNERFYRISKGKISVLRAVHKENKNLQYIIYLDFSKRVNLIILFVRMRVRVCHIS